MWSSGVIDLLDAHCLALKLQLVGSSIAWVKQPFCVCSAEYTLWQRVCT